MQNEEQYNPFNFTKVEVISTKSTTIVSNENGLSQKDYNPFAHRNLNHPNNYAGAFLHLVKASLGTGILAVPRSFKNAGWLVGIIGSVLIGLLSTHTVYILVAASEKVCKKARIPSLSFADTAREVFRNGPPSARKWSAAAKMFVEIALVLTYYLATAVYMVFVAVSLTKLSSYYNPDTASWGQYQFKLMMLIPLLILTQVREIKRMVPFSFIANTMLVIAFGITAYYIISGLKNTSLADVGAANGWSGLPSFYSTVLFAMEGIGAIMPVENSMAEPVFLGTCGVLNSAMSVIVAMFVFFGFLGYYRFGEVTEATITSNLPDDEIPAQIVQAAIAISVFFSFMLVFYIPTDILWTRIKPSIPKEKHNLSQIILRVVMLFIVTGVAIAGGDNLGSLIDLIGAIFFSSLGLLVPAVLDSVVRWEEGWGKFQWILLKNILIGLLAVFGIISGSYYAILEIKD